ncbi:MAG: HAMP domain-containing histidine kinase [Campylobacteraceae bacterium]|nr:HAMP domain-containing histidine kinase [Campylobacteraceae bacterium]
MINSKILNKEIIEDFFSFTDKLIIKIDENSKILDHNEAFSKINKQFSFLDELITITHQKKFKETLKQLNDETNITHTKTNFSLNKDDVNDIPITYNLIIHKNEDNTYTIVAEEAPALSHNDAKEYLAMINNFTFTSRELAKTKQKLQRKNSDLALLTKELQELNTNLEEKVRESIEELRKKDEILFKQTKDAAMGEMIDAIAHQWKNPLGVINLINQQIQIQCLLHDEIKKEDILKSIEKSEQQIKHLVETLEEFRTFFRPKTEKQKVSIITLINSVKVLMKDDLIKYNIEISTDGEVENKIKIIPNEFKHVLINLISNSKDAFVDNNVKKREINISAKTEENYITLKVCDNAGGIPESILDKVFISNFTTKENKGTGVGLYMTKQIIEKLEGKIEVFNTKTGACFKVYLKK